MYLERYEDLQRRKNTKTGNPCVLKGARPREPFYCSSEFCSITTSHLLPASSTKINAKSLSDVRFWTPAAGLLCSLGVIIFIHWVQYTCCTAVGTTTLYHDSGFISWQRIDVFCSVLVVVYLNYLYITKLLEVSRCHYNLAWTFHFKGENIFSVVTLYVGNL